MVGFDLKGPVFDMGERERPTISLKGCDAGVCIRGGESGGCAGLEGEMVVDGWSRWENRCEGEEGEERKERVGDDRYLRDGEEEEGRTENERLNNETRVERRDRYGWMIGSRFRSRREEQEGRQMREQSGPSSFFSSTHSRSESTSQMVKKPDEVDNLGASLRLRRCLCRVLDSVEGKWVLTADLTSKSEFSRFEDMFSGSNSGSDSDSHSPVALPDSTAHMAEGSMKSHLSLRGGAGSKRLDDDQRVPRVIWFFAGGVGRAPTGKGLREWKEKARNNNGDGRKEKVGFWGMIGLGKGRRGKKRKDKNREEKKKGAGGGEGGAQGDAGDAAPGGSKGGAGTAPGEGATGGRGDAKRSAAGETGGSGRGSSGSGSGSGSSGRTE